MVTHETQVTTIGGSCVRADLDSGGIATITMLRGEAYNTMTTAMLDELAECVEWATDPARSRAIILTGTGRAFCAGGDLAEIPTTETRGSLDQTVDQLNRQVRVSVQLRESSVPSIAAINGACAGAGLSLACAADVRFAAAGAKFRTAFLSAGLSGDFGGSWTLPRLVGEAKARELLLLNPKFDAATAVTWGLVAELAEPDELLPRARQVATEWAASGRGIIAAMKANLNESGTPDFGAHLRRESLRHVELSYGIDGSATGPTPR